MTDRELMKQALEALECALSDDRPYIVQCKEAITALREALAEQPAQPQQEPVAWRYLTQYESGASIWTYCAGEPANRETRQPLYTSPPVQRTWVGLTDEEIERACVPLGAAMLSFTEVARAIEAKLREKNT